MPAKPDPLQERIAAFNHARGGVLVHTHRSAEDGREHVRTSWMAMARSAEVLKRCRS